jgi:hypothetical protein
VTALAVVALGLVASACGSSAKTGAGTSPDGATTTSTPPRPEMTVNATDYAYTGMPATIGAGIVKVTFVNKGSVSHELVFLKVSDNNKTTATFAALSGAFQGGPLPADFLAVNGVHDTGPGSTTVSELNLTPGQYIALCGDSGVVGSSTDGKPHFMRGMFAKITVTGTGGTTLPTAAATLTARDYSFDVSQLKAGTQTIAFENAGPKQWHFADLQAFPKGTTVAQAEAILPKMLASNGPPPAGLAVPETIATAAAASPGYGSTLTVTLEKGRTYLLLCFLSDRAGGPPHAIGHRMFKVFTVS